MWAYILPALRGWRLIRTLRLLNAEEKADTRGSAARSVIYIEKLDCTPSSASLWCQFMACGQRPEAGIGKMREACQAADMPKNKPGAGGKSRAGCV